MQWRYGRSWALIGFLVLLSLPALAETVKLYLTDGTYQLAREYQVLPDRVKYLSAERGEWEEIPLNLVDLNRTKREAAAHEQALQQETKEQDEEDAALKAERAEIARVPVEPGAYYIHGDKLDTLKQAEIKIATDKRRRVLSVISPVPLVPGKSTVELDGAASTFRVNENRPEFYFRLAKVEGFAIIKLTAKKNTRVAENASILPVTKEVVEERHLVDTFKKESGDQLFKIWPEKPMEPGEYALIEYTDGDLDPQIWDFGVDAPKP